MPISAALPLAASHDGRSQPSSSRFHDRPSFEPSPGRRRCHARSEREVRRLSCGVKGATPAAAARSRGYLRLPHPRAASPPRPPQTARRNNAPAPCARTSSRAPKAAAVGVQDDSTMQVCQRWPQWWVGMSDRGFEDKGADQSLWQLGGNHPVFGWFRFCPQRAALCLLMVRYTLCADSFIAAEVVCQHSFYRRGSRPTPMPYSQPHRRLGGKRCAWVGSAAPGRLARPGRAERARCGALRRAAVCRRRRARARRGVAAGTV